MSELKCYDSRKSNYKVLKKIDDNWNIVMCKDTRSILWHCSKRCKSDFHLGCVCKNNKALNNAIKQKKFFMVLLQDMR